ncbi:MAG: FtsX-like permease family protein [Verrucomicrobia bacterium]|nr:FtsX-like permease family protein [Verrucomicrobiota bacterium]
MRWILALSNPWTWRMAWRESRSRRGRLLLFGSSIVIGIAALIAIDSFRVSLTRAVEEQAKSLLGADLVVAGRSKFGAAEDAVLRAIGGRQSRETDLSSMVLFPATDGLRLAQVRGLDGDFPYYGALETDPPDAARRWREQGGALVDESLLAQFGAKPGDAVKVGELRTIVVGSLRRVPGDTLAFATLAPRVYLRQQDLEKANLIQLGSLGRYKCYIQLPPGQTAAKALKPVRKQMDQLRLGHTTAEKRQEDLGNAMERLSNFLSLVGFVALFLGGVGVANAIHTHVKEKLAHVAVLRCLGAGEAQTFAIYLAQALVLGAVASTAGVVLGVVVQSLFPFVLGDFLPVTVAFELRPARLLEGFGVGWAFCLLFAALPLLSIRHASPMGALRVASGMGSPRRIGWPEMLMGFLLCFASVVFAMSHTARKLHGVFFMGGLLAALLCLWGTAHALMLALRRRVPAAWPYPWRQGLSNLYRPNNRTTLLLLSLGLGTFVLLTLELTQGVLLRELTKDGGENRPNTVLFDIQPDQRDGVLALVRSNGVRVVEEAPIITMRLAKIQGRTTDQILASTNRQIAKWALRREYRCTWRDKLSGTETLTAGTWHPRFDAAKDPAPVSLEEGIAKDLGVGLGDEIVFDLQGVTIPTRVASLRKVEWRRVQPNFFVVFPPGVLESAPAFHVLATRATSPRQSAELQRSLVAKYPNVSVIDLSLVLSTLDSIVSKISLGIQFMAFFTVATGLLVLMGALWTSRKQRVRETALLRTLGASKGQIRTILMMEYASLGALAAVAASGLALLSSWALVHFLFHASFAPSFAPILAAGALIPGVTLVTGWWSSRGVLDVAPLEILREEG